MKNKDKKFSAALLAGTLCFTVLSGCSSPEVPALSETPALSESLTTPATSISSEASDITQETTDESSQFSEYDLSSMGMIAALPKALTELMNRDDMVVFNYEMDTEDGSALQYGILSWNIVAEEVSSENETTENDYFYLGGNLECIGVLGVYHSDIIDELDELTGCDEHQELDQSEDGTYKYYLSINTQADKELTSILRQIQITTTEMASFDQSVDYDTPVSDFTGTSVGEFTTQDVNGNTYTQEIFQDYDLTLINVFTTWCSPCVAEIPDLEKLYQTMADKGVNVVGVVLDVLDENGEIEQESLERAQLLAEKTGATYPFLLPDTTYMNGRLTGIQAFPETFFVDKNGNIVGETYSGSGSLEDWISVVEKELSHLKEGE